MGTALAAWCCLVACSLMSSLDELDENSGADASTTHCQTGVDCTGCAGCDAWCACLSSGSVAACVAQCLDGGGATGGVSGTSGIGGSGAGGSTGGIGGSGAADASAGGTGGSGTADASAGGTGGSAGSGTAGASGSDGSVAVPFEPGVVHCVATNDCSLLTKHCCVSTQGTATCEGLTVACGGLSADIRCDGPEDCDQGEVCCGELTLGQYVTLAECRSTCASPDVIACGGEQTACPSGDSCVPYVVFNITTPYTICK